MSHFRVWGLQLEITGKVLKSFKGFMQSFQSCQTLCNLVDCSPPGSPVHGILQKEYWNGLPFPSPGDFPDPGIKPASLMSPAVAGRFLPLGPPGKPPRFKGVEVTQLQLQFEKITPTMEKKKGQDGEQSGAKME